LFEGGLEKIITTLYSTSNNFVYDSGKNNQNYYTLTDTYIIVPKKPHLSLKSILAILNSKLIEFYFKNTAKLKRAGYYEYSGGALSKIPIKYDDKFSKKLENLVDEVLVLKQNLSGLEEKTTNERLKIMSEIARIDSLVDELVYESYEITEREREFIESSLK
jgi:hypothetical protein